MAQRPILGVEITGWGGALPEREVTNDELIEKYQLDSYDEWIRSRTGIESRHIAEAHENVVSLGAAAGAAALARAGIRPPAAIEGLFLGSTTSSMYRTVPGSHPGIQRELGLDGYQIEHSEETNTACTSFVTALLNAYFNFAVSDMNRALVVGSDKLSSITDYHDRRSGILFADGAGAVVLERTAGSSSGLLGWARATRGDLEEILYCEPGGTLQMEGHAVFKHAVNMIVDKTTAVLEAAQTAPEDVALVVPHQANVRIMEAAGRRLGIGLDKMAITIGHHGNTSSASIPLALSEAADAGRIERGQKLLLVGFGAGMTAAAAVIEW